MESARAEITANTVAQRPRLADVDRFSLLIREQIHPWLLGQVGDLALEVVDGHTLR
jgi:hypothetical protein